MKAFREQLDALCKKRGIKYVDLAERMGLVPSRISHMVAKEDRLQTDTIERIAHALSVEPEYFDLYVSLKLPEIAREMNGLLDIGRQFIHMARPQKKETRIA